jgi:hypothetical protein
MLKIQCLTNGIARLSASETVMRSIQAIPQTLYRTDLIVVGPEDPQIDTLPAVIKMLYFCDRMNIALTGIYTHCFFNMLRRQKQ